MVNLAGIVIVVTKSSNILTITLTTQSYCVFIVLQLLQSFDSIWISLDICPLVYTNFTSFDFWYITSFDFWFAILPPSDSVKTYLEITVYATYIILLIHTILTNLFHWWEQKYKINMKWVAPPRLLASDKLNIIRTYGFTLIHKYNMLQIWCICLQFLQECYNVLGLIESVVWHFQKYFFSTGVYVMQLSMTNNQVNYPFSIAWILCRFGGFHS